MAEPTNMMSTLRVPWNKGKLVGQKAPFKPKEIWAIRVRLQMEERTRELALFNLGIDTKRLACDLTALRVRDEFVEADIRALMTASTKPDLTWLAKEAPLFRIKRCEMTRQIHGIMKDAKDLDQMSIFVRNYPKHHEMPTLATAASGVQREQAFHNIVAASEA